MSRYYHGTCPVCGGLLFTVDAIIIECEKCDYMSTDMSPILNYLAEKAALKEEPSNENNNHK